MTKLKFKPTPQMMQSADIWSLGCVFSLAATWIALGQEGLATYASFRTQESKKSLLTTRDLHAATSTTENAIQHMAYGDVFHDGQRVLPGVKRWHSFLRSVLRISDNTTAMILDLIDHGMFVDQEDRMNARDICERFTTILKDGASDPVVSTFGDLADRLSAIESVDFEYTAPKTTTWISTSRQG
jgi:hypothetical protein